ncbi:MAG: hypothetical protein GXP42_01875 [Chloroflexi bacterium]|nr:hypothetical protein [Chloroflexota bacterium]
MKTKIDQPMFDAGRGLPRLMMAIGVLLALAALLLASLQQPVQARTRVAPQIGVNYAHNWAEVTEAAANTTVTITISGKGEKTGAADESGYFLAGEWEPPIEVGDMVTVENENITRTLKVGEITGQVDYEADKVTGVVNAAWLSPTLVSVECHIWIEQLPPPVTVDDVNPAGGSFECDFNGVWDIELNQTVGIQYITQDGDQVINALAAPWVRVQYGHDWVGADYEAGHTFWITVTDSADNVKATAQVDTQPRGGWQGDGFQTEPQHWTPENPDIQAGDWVYFRADDGYTNTVRVGDIGGVVDTETDSVSGAIQAPWFAGALDVECHPWGGWQAGWDQAPVVNSTAAADGSSSYMCQWDPQTEWDVQINQDIAVFYYIPNTRDLVGNVFRAEPPSGPRYVAVTGSDVDNDCRDPQSPCATIQHAIDQAAWDDEIRVAKGTYTENLTVSLPVSLTGGYEAATWTRDPAQYETIIDGSNSRPIPGDWDGRFVYGPAVVTDGGQYQMWYTGSGMGGRFSVGLATSSDGVQWTKADENPLLDGTEASVLKEGGNQYVMWFNREDGAIYRATSTDGVAWTVDPETPVFEPTHQDGTWDRNAVGDPSVIRDGNGQYWMYYEGVNVGMDGVQVQIGVVTSTNGINWTRVLTEPVLTPGDAGAWDGLWVLDPAVMLKDGVFKMWYTGRTNDGRRSIGYATSDDGVHWTKDTAHNPVLSPEDGQWDEGSIGNHAVLYDGKYKMWYSSNGQIGYATSPDGVAWTKSENNPVLTPGDPGQGGEPVVRFEPESGESLLDGFTITGGDVMQDGGGITIRGASPHIRACIIRGNRAQGPDEWGGGGLLIGEGASPVIEDSVIVDNSVGGGAGAVRVGDASFTMMNTLVAGNSGRPAIHANNASMTLINVTLADNGPHGGILLNQSHGTILNSILWEEEGEDIVAANGGDFTMTYSDVEDGAPAGEGNISADPMFVNPTQGDYRLRAGSPAIDAGTNQSAPDHDLDGLSRPFDGNGDGDAITDMGAYEFRHRLNFPLLLGQSPGSSAFQGMEP